MTVLDGAVHAAQGWGLDGEHQISPHARSKITLRLAKIAEQKCQEHIEAFNLCCKGRSITQIFCKPKYDASQECVHRYMNEANLHLVAQRWIDLGRPTKPDWGQLLAGVAEAGDRQGQAQGQAAQAQA
ncbi:hypothetical protein HYH03_001013 [Edaphochlamys debaryana]|uniref:COX assembly mitochondrial protein n=1 Tax=Edaphochlamys debaryana TaxID=47281 RepID=A0A835YNZ0_9CHLO|nr:hypothetical protein HYH03_001013 [Edaphochlamys debaryana]|eukprot:KAG2501199.1 hypothetical protein HYH03_001013 [Edaphochlamys debaryana]